MSKSIVWVALILLITATAELPVRAADKKATTDEIPAALDALGVDRQLIVSQGEADLIRGDRYYVHFPLNAGVGTLNLRAQGEGVLRLTIISPRYVLRLRVGD